MMFELKEKSPAAIRQVIRENRYTGPTPGLAPGYAQANLLVIPERMAFDFLLFCQRNPKPCPVLDVTDVGSAVPEILAPGADIRTDIPRYRIYKNGALVDEVLDIKEFWRDDLVAFLLGCSFTFETALLEAGIGIRHIEERRNVPMFITNIRCRPAGKFSGAMVVSMRPIPRDQVVRAVEVTGRFPAVHGTPVHIGDPEAIGIKDINRPDFGDAVTIKPGEVPVFWACGVTPQVAVMEVKPELAISHAPGHMFIGDLRDAELAVC